MTRNIELSTGSNFLIAVVNAALIALMGGPAWAAGAVFVVVFQLWNAADWLLSHLRE